MDLVIGNGLIGSNLYWYLRRFGETVMTTRKEVNLDCDDWDLPACDTAYICVGKTSTRECEESPEETRRVNVENTVKLVEKLSKKSFVVWISSERVFDGSVPFRRVDDKVCPTTEYGRQKVETEKLLRDLGVGIVRFSKVLGFNVPPFGDWIELLKKNMEIYPFSNMGMAPIPVSFAVDVLRRMGKNKMSGLYQVSGDRDISYDRIAFHIANYMGVDLGLVRPVEAKESHPYTTLESNLGMDVPDSWVTIENWCRDKKFELLGRTR